MASASCAKLSRIGPTYPPDWTGLSSGPAGLIADRLLSSDVADYCAPDGARAAWTRERRPSATAGSTPGDGSCSRAPTISPATGGASSTSHTGECVHMRIPDLRNYYLLGSTVEGLLVLCQKGTATELVQLLNPLTGQLTDLPSLDTMMVV
nr:unnamed protein product [Digitaria exilis]